MALLQICNGKTVEIGNHFLNERSISNSVKNVNPRGKGKKEEKCWRGWWRLPWSAWDYLAVVMGCAAERQEQVRRTGRGLLSTFCTCGAMAEVWVRLLEQTLQRTISMASMLEVNSVSSVVDSSPSHMSYRDWRRPFGSFSYLQTIFFYICICCVCPVRGSERGATLGLSSWTLPNRYIVNGCGTFRIGSSFWLKVATVGRRSLTYVFVLTTEC